MQNFITNSNNNFLKRKQKIDLRDFPLKKLQLDFPMNINLLSMTSQINNISEPNKDQLQQQIKKLIEQNPKELIKSGKDYQFGNYKNYYNNRYEKRWQDSRLKLIESKKYFLNKNVLDIGCNDGSLTLQIAIKYFPLKIVGIDLDYKLINQAVDNMKFLEKQQLNSKNKNKQNQQSQQQSQSNSSHTKTKSLLEKLKRLPMNFLKNDAINKLLDKSYLQENAIQAFDDDNNNDSKINIEDKEQIEKQQKQQQQQQQDEIKNHELVIIKRFPDNIEFRIENYVQDLDRIERYDTIICFSVTKYIQLNFGDEGIKRLFEKVSKSLKHGGYFILEPQEWKSYKKKKNMTQIFKENFNNIELKPSKFKDYLIENLKFQLLKEIRPDQGENLGFKRIIYIFQKTQQHL